MIGIVPSQLKTFDVVGDFSVTDPKLEGNLYVDPTDGRLYMFSTSLTRSCPETGYFPIWDGENRMVTKFSNEKYLERDVIRTDLVSMSSAINGEKADQIRYQQLRSINENLLKPTISPGDNMFTQIIKALINLKGVTLIDLVYMSGLSEKVIRNYYSALTKITFMRHDRWKIWLSQIFHLGYVITVKRQDGAQLVSYRYPDDTFDTGSVSYDSIVSSKADPFKKLVKVIMTMENISKADLRSDEVDDYTVNNMLTTINTDKSLSAQLFSRFIRMTGLGFRMELFERDPVTEEDKVIFVYSE